MKGRKKDETGFLHGREIVEESIELINALSEKGFNAVEAVLILGLAHSMAVIELGVDKAGSNLN